MVQNVTCVGGPGPLPPARHRMTQYVNNHSSRYDVTAVPTEYCKLLTDRVYHVRKGQSQEIKPYVMTRFEDAAQPPKLGKLNYKIYYILGLVFALKMASSFINLQRLNKEWLINKNDYNVSSNWDEKFATRKEGMCLVTSGPVTFWTSGRAS